MTDHSASGGALIDAGAEAQRAERYRQRITEARSCYQDMTQAIQQYYVTRMARAQADYAYAIDAALTEFLAAP